MDQSAHRGSREMSGVSSAAEPARCSAPAPLDRLLRAASSPLAMGMAQAALAVGVGLWLKWRELLLPDPESWYVHSWRQLAYTDLVALYLQQGLASHPIPYLETRLEYPVVVGAAQYLASFAPGPAGYLAAAGLMLGAAGLGVVWLVLRMNPSARVWAFTATPPLLLYASMNWDLLALLFALLGLHLFKRRREGWSALFLALGIWTKLFPAVLLAWVIFRRAMERDWGSVARMAGIVGGVSVALNLPIYLVSPQGWLHFFQFQGARAPDAGSVWSYLAGWSVSTVNLASLLVSVVGIAALAVVGMRRGMGDHEFGLGGLALLILASKVTSPQYDLWLMPFLALLRAPLWLVGLFVGVDLAYLWSSAQMLQVHWGQPSMLGGLFSPVTGALNGAHQVALLVVLAWAIGTGRWRRKGASTRPDGPGG